MSDQVTLTIDGRAVQVPKGTNLIEAARQAGIDIPYFCYHPKLDPAGVCRMCLVQIEKIPKPQTACTTTVSEGMVVQTQHTSPLAAELQKGVLEFLLLNHPLDCPVCDKGGECDLQDLTFAHGPGASRLQEAKIHKDKAVDLGNFIVLDRERCILCRRCTRFDDQVATEGNLIIEARGHHNEVATMDGQRYDSYFSGNTIELCPVGALTSDIYRFKARPWDLAKVDAVCTQCSVGCNLHEEFRHGRLLRLTARENPATDDGWLCDRGRFNYRFVHSPERLTQPMLRRDGLLVPATWQEALSLIAARFKEIKARVGGKGFGLIGGGRLTNEEAYLLQKFGRSLLGTNNIDHRTADQVVVSLGAFAGRQTDLSDATAILLVDIDPAERAPVMDLRIRRMADRHKAKIATIGALWPAYRGRHTRIQVRPGESAGVLTALAAAISGAKPHPAMPDQPSVLKLAETLSTSAKTVVVWDGADPRTGRALLDLANAIKKAVGRNVLVLIPGAQHNSRGAEAMGLLPGLLPGFASVSDARAREAVGQLWFNRHLPAEPGLASREMLQAARAGEIEALLLAGANLLNTYPDRRLAEAALDTAFTVVIDLFMNETAAKADVLLPAAAFSEKSGTYTALDGLVQSFRAAKRPEGEAKADDEILVNLALAMGAKLSTSPSDTAAEIGRLYTKLQDGAVLGGAPTSLLPQVGPAAHVPAGLQLVPIDKLYAGGSTARFDPDFAHVRPTPVARLNPADAARLGLKSGEQVELAAGDASITLGVEIDRHVVPGTVQAIKGLSAAPVNLLTGGGAPVVVTVAKLAVGVAD